jgi:hypothetical protein
MFNNSGIFIPSNDQLGKESRLAVDILFSQSAFTMVWQHYDVAFNLEQSNGAMKALFNCTAAAQGCVYGLIYSLVMPKRI